MFVCMSSFWRFMARASCVVMETRAVATGPRAVAKGRVFCVYVDTIAITGTIEKPLP